MVNSTNVFPVEIIMWVEFIGCYDNHKITAGEDEKMDSETLFSDLDYLGSGGIVVSVEQKASLQSSLVTLKRKHKFRRVKLWGIIRGVQRDYFIVHGVGRNELIDKKALYRQVKKYGFKPAVLFFFG